MYNNGVMIFEGEYLNGEKNGCAKEYNESGFLEFEGEYLNGEITSGIKRKYYVNVNLRKETQYNDGKNLNKFYIIIMVKKNMK